MHIFKNIPHEPIGYNTNVSTGRVEWGRLNNHLDSTPRKLQGDIDVVVISLSFKIISHAYCWLAPLAFLYPNNSQYNN